MSKYSVFMKKLPKLETKEIVFDRFKSDGKAVPIILKELSTEEREACFDTIADNDNKFRSKLMKAITIASIVEPNLKSKELCDYYETHRAEEVALRMFTAEEFDELQKEAMILNKLVKEEEINKIFNKELKEAKN